MMMLRYLVVALGLGFASDGLAITLPPGLGSQLNIQNNTPSHLTLVSIDPPSDISIYWNNFSPTEHLAQGMNEAAEVLNASLNQTRYTLVYRSPDSKFHCTISFDVGALFQDQILPSTEKDSCEGNMKWTTNFSYYTGTPDTVMIYLWTINATPESK